MLREEWKVEKNNGEYWIIDNDKATVAWVYSEYRDSSKDAFLISAAPEMLEALESVCHNCAEWSTVDANCCGCNAYKGKEILLKFSL